MAAKEHVTDEELDELLDDALLDFESNEESSNNTPLSQAFNQKSVPVKSLTKEEMEASMPQMDPSSIFSQFFDPETTKTLTEEWGNAMRELKQEDPELMELIKKDAAQARFSTSQSSDAPTGDHTATCSDSETKSKGSIQDDLKSTFKSMAQDIKGKSGSGSRGMDGSLEGAFDSLNLEGIDDEDLFDKEIGMIENVMSTLLSKSMMHGPIKELCDKFPPWIEANRKSISAEKMANYEKQLACLKRLCAELEREKEGESEEEKASRTQKIIAMVDEMQEYGDPPKEITGDSPLGVGDMPSLNPADACKVS